MEDINRAVQGGFIKYMLANPYYFKSLSGTEARKENIVAYWRKLQESGLVAAANIPLSCIRCKKSFNKCPNCRKNNRRNIKTEDLSEWNDA